MTKNEIHQQFMDRLSDELASITAAAKSTFATATDEAHQAECKYDTFSLESSYLARGQAKRAQELATAVALLQMLPLKALDDTTPIQLGALVRIKANDGEERTLLVAPAGGGEAVVVDDETVTIITSKSPIGQALVGNTVGDTFEMKTGLRPQTFSIVSVE